MVNTNRNISLKNIVTLWFVLSLVFISILSGCGRDEVDMHNESSSTESTSSVMVSNTSSLPGWGDYPLVMIRIDGKYYTCLDVINDTPDDSQVKGHITSVRPDDSDVWWCIEDDQASAGFWEFLNAPYAQVDDKMIIKHGEDWHLLSEFDFTEPYPAD